ncbi:MAG: 4,5-dihydroxyphthalate decarboxylase, partial [Alphaproteobacteria bacterium]
MGKLRINIATSDYDHFRDIAMGRVEVEGIDLNYLNLTIEEIFYRFTLNREWEVSEMSMAKFVAQVAGDRPDILAIPVFPSRVFRLSNIYLPRGSDIKSPEQLAGKKMGTPEWAQTASVYTRGWLVDDVGIKLQDIDWYQAGVNQPGRTEKVKLNLPQGVKLTSMPETCLEELLLTGGVDAIMSAHPPDAYAAGNPDIVRLYPDYQKAEEEYYKRTKIFPIMHIIAIQTRVLDENPWVARNLLTAFQQARARSLYRIDEMTASRFLVPWLGSTLADRQELLGDDYFPYGIENNRTTLEAFLRWTYEQGITMKHLKVEELFPKTVQSSFKV